MASLKTELEEIHTALDRSFTHYEINKHVARLGVVIEKMNTTVKPYGWQDELLQQIADKLNLPAGADLEGILPLLDEKLK